MEIPGSNEIIFAHFTGQVGEPAGPGPGGGGGGPDLFDGIQDGLKDDLTEDLASVHG